MAYDNTKRLNKLLRDYDPVFTTMLLAWLNGDISARQAAKELGMSHQGWINLTSSTFRYLYQQSKLTIKDKL